MNAILRGAWGSRSAREQTIVIALIVLLAGALYTWFVYSAEMSRVQLRSSVTALRAQAARLDQQALEHRRLRAAPAATSSSTDLRKLVQERADAAGLARALVRIDALEPDRVVVVFGAVAFADWLDWIAGLQAQQVRLEAGRVEALAARGQVSVTATLARPKYE